MRDERAKVLRSIRIMKPEEAAIYSVAGQYGPARIGNDDVPGISPGSRESIRMRRPTRTRL